MTPLAGGPMRVIPKLSHEGRTYPPSSTMPAGVCQIVIFSTSARNAQHSQSPAGSEVAQVATAQSALSCVS